MPRSLSHREQWHTRNIRGGLTLVEVCLVLALLVVFGALAAPVMEGAISRAALKGAGDRLRGAWAKSRLAAMQSGQTVVFRFEPNGSRYQAVYLNQLDLPETNEFTTANSKKVDEPADMLRLAGNQLPEDVTFTAGDMQASSQVNALFGQTEGPWSGPILFHPDGTTSDASVVLTNDREQSIRVTLRGLTGIANATEVGDEVEP
jgi:Tfp pilus assembly protein FimT